MHIIERLPSKCIMRLMDWFSIAFVGLAVFAAGLCVHRVSRVRNDPDNWVIDPFTKNLHFQNWAEVSYAGFVLLLSSGVIGIAVFV
ncbi:hypothetical protein [Aurantiacibacter gilvus]|uniref:Uncharacterized protein n=1 Tax=Aurantiacibacter gilvus TaxID=3139141 RepID=A0ABU9IDF5_9SPHN